MKILHVRMKADPTDNEIAEATLAAIFAAGQDGAPSTVTRAQAASNRRRFAHPLRCAELPANTPASDRAKLGCAGRPPSHA